MRYRRESVVPVCPWWSLESNHVIGWNVFIHTSHVIRLKGKWLLLWNAPRGKDRCNRKEEIEAGSFKRRVLFRQEKTELVLADSFILPCKFYSTTGQWTSLQKVKNLAPLETTPVIRHRRGYDVFLECTAGLKFGQGWVCGRFSPPARNSIRRWAKPRELVPRSRHHVFQCILSSAFHTQRGRREEDLLYTANSDNEMP